MKTVTLDKARNSRIKDIGLALLILLWCYTGLSKIIQHQHFTFQMSLSPSNFVAANHEVLGWIVPISELLLVLMLISTSFRIWGLFGSMILLVIFEIYIVSMLFSQHLPCACGGVIGALSWKGHVVFNAVFVLIATLLSFFEYRRAVAR